MKKSQERKGLPSFRNANRNKLKEEVKKVNWVLEKVDVEDITATNMLIYAGAVVVTERLGLKTGKTSQKREPLWKRRLEAEWNHSRMALSMSMKISNNDSLPSLKRCRDIRTGISSLYKTECSKRTNEDSTKSSTVTVTVPR